MPSLETAHLKHDMTGRKFGRLFVVSYSHMQRKLSHWVCACACGNIKTISSSSLKSSTTKSCGCLRRDAIRTASLSNIKHGMSRTRIYRTWHQMNVRCYNKTHNRYHLYGGRGIAVCAAWRSNFNNFKEWALANGYRDDLQIDRRDNEKGYSPSNCRFVTAKENSNNRRGSKLYEFNGRLLNETDIAKAVGISRGTLNERLRSGMPLTDAIKAIIQRKANRNQKARQSGES